MRFIGFCLLLVSHSVAFAQNKTNPDLSIHSLFIYRQGGEGNAGESEAPNGFALQEAEIRLTSNIDSYFRGDLVLAASPHLDKVKYKVEQDGEKPKIIIDEAATANALSGLPNEDRAWIMNLAKYILSTLEKQNIGGEEEIDSKPPGLILKKLHPGVSLSEAMKREMDKALASAASLKQLSPLEGALFFEKSSPDRISAIAESVAKGTVTETEAREILAWNSRINLYKALLQNPKSPLLAHEAPPVEVLIKSAGGESAVVRHVVDERKNVELKFNQEISSCQAHHYVNRGLLPSVAQVETMKGDIIRAKQMAIETIKTKFPPSTHKELIKVVEDTDFIIPPTAAEYEKNFTDSLKARVASVKVVNASLAKVSPAEIREIMAALASKDKKQESDSDENEFNETCGAFKYSPMSDANYTTYGSVILSFSTVTGEEKGRIDTVLHELGHSISRAI